MSYYLETDSVDCDCEVVILDSNDYLVLASLIDFQVKNKKVVADIISNFSPQLKNFEDSSFRRRINTYSQSYNFKSSKMGDRTHTIIKSDKLEKTFVNWDKDNLFKALARHIQYNFFIPVTTEMVEALFELDKTTNTKTFDKLDCYSCNPDFQPVAYYINTTALKNRLEKINIDLQESVEDWDKIVDTESYLLKFIDPIKTKIYDNIEVMYDPNVIDPEMFKGEMKPLPGQIKIIQAGLEALKLDPFVYLAVTQGGGKTFMGGTINHCHNAHKSNYLTLAVVPTITLKHWENELKKSIGRPINVFIIERTTDFIKMYNKGLVFDKPTYILVGKETLKLDAPKKHGVNFRTREVDIETKNVWGNIEHSKETHTIGYCPDCGEPLINPLRVCKTYLTPDDFGKEPKKSNYKCSQCTSVLWQSTYDKTKKSSLIRFIKSKNIMFDSIILDEVHQSNNSGSIIGNATRCLAKFTTKSILLSGTTNNGYASSFHNLMMAYKSRTLKADGCLNKDEFIKKYGTLIGSKDEKDAKFKFSGKVVMNESDYRESEGVNPVFFTKYLARNYIFATLNDLSDSLPNINEYYIPIEPPQTLSFNEKTLCQDFKDLNVFTWKMYQNTIVRHYLNNPQSWGAIPVTGKGGGGIVQPRNMNFSILPKDEWLLNIVKKELSEGRKVCIYTHFTGDNGSGQYMTGTNISHRIKSLLSDAGIDSLILHRNVKAIDRKEYIDKNTDKYDVLISNPKLVEVGVNLQAFTTYINYIPDYQVNVVDQSNKRGYRINSTKDNRIYHPYYEGTSEEDIINRYQLKKLESKAIESKFDVEANVTRTASGLSKKLDMAMRK